MTTVPGYVAMSMRNQIWTVCVWECGLCTQRGQALYDAQTADVTLPDGWTRHTAVRDGEVHELAMCWDCAHGTRTVGTELHLSADEGVEEDDRG